MIHFPTIWYKLQHYKGHDTQYIAGQGDRKAALTMCVLLVGVKAEQLIRDKQVHMQLFCNTKAVI